MTGSREIETPLSELPVADQKGIARRLGEAPANLRAIRIETAGGYLFFVSGVGEICGANNCEFWVLSSKYDVLLEKAIQTFKVVSSSHQVLPDIVTSMHGSAFESSLSYWRFNGKRYLRVACADSSYKDTDGKELEKPKIVVVRCGSRG